MLIKNKKIIITFFISLFLFNFNLNAEEFDISAKEIAIDQKNEVIIGTGSVVAKASDGKIVYADKITYKNPL